MHYLWIGVYMNLNIYQNNYGLGLDVGIASIGWALVALDENGFPFKIIDLGSRIFDKAENPKDGSSLASLRREFRSQRRLIRRRRYRLDRAIRLFCRIGLCTEEKIKILFNTPSNKDVYQLRYEALERKLFDEEWIRVLYSLLKRRGFKSNRKNQKTEDGKLLAAIKTNSELMQTKNYKTVGEMLYKDPVFAEAKRNKGEEYKNSVSRLSIENEIKILFDMQKQFGNEFAYDDFKNDYLKIFLSQRNFDEGPGEPSPYGGNQIEKMIGFCSLEKNLHRAPKANLSFSLFSFWCKINNIRYFNASTGEEFSLSSEQSEILLLKALNKSDFSYADIRKTINLSNDCYFKEISYTQNKSKKQEKAKKEPIGRNNSSSIVLNTTQNENCADNLFEIEKKYKIKFFTPYIQMKKAAKGLLDNLNPLDPEDRKTFNKIAYAFTISKNDEGIAKILQDFQISPNITDILLENMDSFSKFGHISECACEKLLPFLEKGEDYVSACKSANYMNDEQESKDLLPARSPELDDILNPVVRRSVSQLIKVINAIIRKYGKPQYINIEFARDLPKSFSDRIKIKKLQEDRHESNNKIKKEIENIYKINPKPRDILIYKLWLEQNSQSMYSGEAIEASRLFEPGYVEIDHILPFSRSFDDSFNNKVLVLKKENQNKKNQTPLEYLTTLHNDQTIQNYKARIFSFYKHYPIKMRNLLTEHYTNTRDEWNSANLNDTRYISKFIHSYIKENLFPQRKGPKKVRAVNGMITSLLRGFWGIKKVREDGDLHHAVDAVIISVVTDKNINKLSEAYKRHELSGKKIHIEEPWHSFVDELIARLSDNPAEKIKELDLNSYNENELSSISKPFVSRMPRHKVSGSAHDATIRSTVLFKHGIKDSVVSKISVDKIKLENLPNNENSKSKSIELYKPETDIRLYSSLEQYLKNNSDSKEEIHKIKKDGTPGPVVKRIKVINKSSLGVLLNDGKAFANNGKMIRVDVFRITEGNDKGYYFVPIYVADTVKNMLPNKACIPNKNYESWKEMNENDFVFSLYSNDLIYVRSNTKKKLSFKKNDSSNQNVERDQVFLYFTSADIATASFNTDFVDNSYSKHGMGIKTMSEIKKYTVDVLGNIHEVKKEKRLGFKNNKSKK